MKKENKVLKLKKSTISELNIEKAGEVIEGKTGAQAVCVSELDFRIYFTSLREVIVGC